MKSGSLGLDGQSSVKARTLVDTAEGDSPERASSREEESLAGPSPDRTVPCTPGESANALTGRGDAVETQMQAAEPTMVMPTTRSNLEAAETGVDRPKPPFPGREPASASGRDSTAETTTPSSEVPQL